MENLILNVIKIGGVGCVVFTLFILFMSYSGIASEMRDEAGNFKKTRSLKAIFGLIFFASILFGLLYVGNLSLIKSASENPAFILLWINSFGIFFVIHLYDLIFLDYLIIVKWHPKFLKLPDTDYYKSFKPHLQGFVKGIPLGIIVSLLSSILTITFN